jgi:hypothetical protein
LLGFHMDFIGVTPARPGCSGRDSTDGSGLYLQPG